MTYYYKHKKGIFEFPEIINKEGYVLISEEEARDILDKEDKIFQIHKAKQDLKDSDYKIIQCLEIYLASLEDILPSLNLPYDIQSLHQERDNLRNLINTYEKEI